MKQRWPAFRALVLSALAVSGPLPYQPARVEANPPARGPRDPAAQTKTNPPAPRQPERPPQGKDGPPAQGNTAGPTQGQAGGPTRSASRPAAGGQETPERPRSAPRAPAGDPGSLLDPYRDGGLLKRLAAVPKVLALSEDDFVARFRPLLTGDRNRLILRIRELVAALGDLRYEVREKAELELKHLGPRALPILDELGEPEDLEAKIRLRYVLKELRAMGNEDLVKRALRARVLAEALAYRPGAPEVEALLAALDHVDRRVRLAAIRALGRQLARPQLGRKYGERLLSALRGSLETPDLVLRNAVLTAAGSIPTAEAAAFLEHIATDAKRPRSLRILALSLLAARADTTPAALARAAAGDPFLGAVARALGERRARDAGVPSPAVRITLQDDPEFGLETEIRGLHGDEIAVRGAPDRGLPEEIRIPRNTVEDVEILSSEPAPAPAGVHLVLKSGTRLAVADLSLEDRTLRAKALGRRLVIPLDLVRGFLGNPTMKRFFGGSREHDQLRLNRSPKKPIAGRLAGFTAEGPRFATAEGTLEPSWHEVRSLLLALDPGRGPATPPGDLNQFAEADLRDGQKLVGYLCDLDGHDVLLAAPKLGVIDIPLEGCSRLKLHSSGSALSGFTLVVDYGNIRVFEVDNEGKEVWAMPVELFEPVDAELLPDGNLLITEQVDNAVRIYDRTGRELWSFEDLDTPRDADHLPNGNVLITDTKNRRVIEVTPAKKIVWTFGVKEAKDSRFKPYDADRLPNGNTLITDFGRARVIEVTPEGSIVWEQRNLGFPFDADRLPNGDTLITIHKTGKGPATGKVVEFDPSHKVVWQLTRLKNPSDADRLPDGTTMVAEVAGISIYSRQGKVLSRIPTDWATEANRY